MFELDAGIVEIKLIQVEFHFRFRNIIIVPKTIQVWYSLGMQSLLIPDSSFRLIGDEIAEEGEMNKCLHNDKSECIHARLHHNGKICSGVYGTNQKNCPTNRSKKQTWV